MNDNKRLTTHSEVYDGITLKAFCESCGESDCREFCCDDTEMPKCDTCPVQKAFERLAQYEDLDLSPSEIIKLIKVKDDLLEACEKALRFIVNGRELNYIKMPDTDSGDVALETPKIIRKAIAKATEVKSMTDTCPKCGNKLIHESGCIHCIACDYGLCG